MVDITIFELHIDDIKVETPWTEESDTDGDDSGGLPVAVLGLTGLLALVAVGAVVVWKRRS